jgi:hypothetical protein
MTSTASPTGDHAYFQTIEESFIRLRGAPLLLSPSDWQLARQWRREGIPLALVLATLEQVFAQRAARGAKGRIQGLRYCADAMERAWQEHQDLVAIGARREQPEMDVSPRLEALASALPESLPHREQITERLRALTGSSEDVERALMLIDQEVIALAAESLDSATREGIERSVEEALVKLASRISPEDRSVIRDRLYRQTLRRRANLPLLSLFAPEAES